MGGPRASPACRVRTYSRGGGCTRGPVAWHGFDVEIAYPPSYPFDKLAVRPSDVAIRRQRHQAGPSGELCYMQEELEPWVVGHGIERAIEGAEDWFRGYVSGVFANEVPAGELLAYLEPEAAFVRTVLMQSCS